MAKLIMEHHLHWINLNNLSAHRRENINFNNVDFLSDARRECFLITFLSQLSFKWQLLSPFLTNPTPTITPIPNPTPFNVTNYKYNVQFYNTSIYFFYLYVHIYDLLNKGIGSHLTLKWSTNRHSRAEYARLNYGITQR